MSRHIEIFAFFSLLRSLPSNLQKMGHPQRGVNPFQSVRTNYGGNNSLSLSHSRKGENGTPFASTFCLPSSSLRLSLKVAAGFIRSNRRIFTTRSPHGCQMAIARFLDCMRLALRASGLWLCYAMLHNLIPSFPWIAPPRPPPWRNPRKGRDQILYSGSTGSPLPLRSPSATRAYRLFY